MHVNDLGTPGKVKSAQRFEVFGNGFYSIVRNLAAARETQGGQVQKRPGGGGGLMGFLFGFWGFLEGFLGVILGDFLGGVYEGYLGVILKGFWGGFMKVF